VITTEIEWYASYCCYVCKAVEVTIADVSDDDGSLAQSLALQESQLRINR